MVRPFAFDGDLFCLGESWDFLHARSYVVGFTGVIRADHHTAPKKGLSKVLARFNDWFDAQADRYGHVVEWALHHRRWMGAIALASLVGALVLRCKFWWHKFPARL